MVVVVLVGDVVAVMIFIIRNRLITFLLTYILDQKIDLLVLCKLDGFSQSKDKVIFDTKLGYYFHLDFLNVL